ncbi:hypothetical protein PM082_008463 [Marasmius tenuissimus]|nr:hypothetical protein PM082_008463 [Marasmius tenuissimus]
MYAICFGDPTFVSDETQMCSSEFTRSDLLSRHKKTCGNSQHSQRSRQKSCQACADSKIKCDLVYPCSKCTTRGRVCIFVNDPEVSRLKRLASKRKSATAQAESSRASPASSRSTPSPSITSVHPDIADPSCSAHTEFEQTELRWNFGSESEGTDYEPATPSPRSSIHELFYADPTAPSSPTSLSMATTNTSTYPQADYSNGVLVEGSFSGSVPPKPTYYDNFDPSSSFTPYDLSTTPTLPAPVQHTPGLSYEMLRGTYRHSSERSTTNMASNSIMQTGGQPSYLKSWFPDNSAHFPFPPAGTARPYLY